MEYRHIVICDNGTSQMKVGFFNEPAPRYVFPTVVGRPRHPQMTPAAPYYVGQDALEYRHSHNLTLSYPINRGLIVNYRDMEAIWEYMFTKVLSVNPRECVVLLTEAPNADPAGDGRKRMADIMFYTFYVQAICIANQAVLSLLAHGRSTGLVWESGDGETHVVPIYHGSVITNGVVTGPVAGRDLTEHLHMLFRDDGNLPGTTPRPFQQRELREMKETYVYVAEDAAEVEGAQNSNIGTTWHMLSDRSQVPVTLWHKLACAEALFYPRLMHLRGTGVPTNIFRSITRCPDDLRQPLLQNMVLSGGSSRFRGLVERLEKEIETIFPNTTFNIIRRLDIEHAVWMGGSVAFPDFWGSIVTSEQYRLDEKCIKSKYIGA